MNYGYRYGMKITEKPMILISHSTRVSAILLFAILLSACGKSKYEKMSNSELKEKQRHCDSIPKKSAVFANGCAKIEKEIERRRSEKK